MSLRCACGEQAVYASCELLLLVYDLRLLCMVGDAPAVCLCGASWGRCVCLCAYHACLCSPSFVYHTWLNVPGGDVFTYMRVSVCCLCCCLAGRDDWVLLFVCNGLRSCCGSASCVIFKKCLGCVLCLCGADCICCL